MTTAQPVGRPVQQIGQPLRPAEATAMLLLEAKESPKAVTRRLAGKVEDLLVELRDRVKAEAEEKRAAERHEAERRAAVEEVARAEAALKAAREKVRKFKHHPGGNGRATVTRSPSPESRKPGGRATATANREGYTSHHDAILARHGVTVRQVREWALEQGMRPPMQGRYVSREVIDAFDSAHQQATG